jgi:F-box and leucine-rich repeat protein 14
MYLDLSDTARPYAQPSPPGEREASGAGNFDLSRLSASLQRLDLARCAFQRADAPLATISTLARLTALCLAGCMAADARAMSHLSSLGELVLLCLAGCYCIDAASLAHLSPLTKMESLNLTGVYTITAAGVEHLAPLVCLRHLALGACNLSA